jgi:hypothetical protein
MAEQPQPDQQEPRSPGKAASRGLRASEQGSEMDRKWPHPVIIGSQIRSISPKQKTVQKQKKWASLRI